MADPRFPGDPSIAKKVRLLNVGVDDNAVDTVCTSKQCYSHLASLEEIWTLRDPFFKSLTRTLDCGKRRGGPRSSI
jgi:hypothetical protein